MGVAAATVPEFVSDQDDPPLEEDGGEHLQQFVNGETLKQTVKVHMFQSGIHWSTQSYNLDSNKETSFKYRVRSQIAASKSDFHRCTAISLQLLC